MHSRIELGTGKWTNCLAAVLLCIFGSDLLVAGSLDEMYDDAELTCVYFVDVDHGWAAGDRGVIWRTDDGGRTWHRQASQTNARLESIHFVDHENGWIVGGYTHPFTHRTSGVILRTRDGGRHWTVLRGHSLPVLRKIHMLNVREGWAVGGSSNLYPSGIFRTNDGGRSWSSVPAPAENWIAGDFHSSKQGVVVGRDGRIATVNGMKVFDADLPDLGLRHVHNVKIVGQSDGWLVGDRGLILQRNSADGSWRLPTGALDPSAEQFDMYALSTLGPRCWIAGLPGTRVFHSSDFGQTWTSFETATTVPIRAIFFANEKYGWAVGSFGTIQATRDGGQTWQIQRAGGERAALLTITGDTRQIPFAMFAQVCGNRGYLGVIELIGRRDLDVPKTPTQPLGFRLHEAMTMVGGSAAYQSHQFPLRQHGVASNREDILKQWSRISEDPGEQVLDEYLVRRIRQWRPEVIVTDSKAMSGMGKLIHQATLKAVQAAAQPTAYPQHAAIGLRPWATKKVFASLKPGARGTLAIQTQALAPRLGRSIGDQGAIGGSLLAHDYELPPESLSFQLVTNVLPPELARRDIMSGISLPHGGGARRRISSGAGIDTGKLVHAMQKRRNMEQLIDRAGKAGGGASWVGQLDDVVKGMPFDSAVQILYQLAQQFHKSGQQALAAGVMERIVKEFPQHPLAEPCMIWLIQYYSSGELEWRQRRGTLASTSVGVATAEARRPRVIDPAAPTPLASPIVQASANSRTARTDMKRSDRAAIAVALSKTIERTRPELFFEPSLRFPLAMAQKRLGVGRKAEQYIHRLAGQKQLQGWWHCAQAEIWLSHGMHTPPKSVLHCQRRKEAPFLDGRLTEQSWQELPLTVLESSYRDDSDWPAVAMMYHDSKFLYVAVSCQKSKKILYSSRTEKRKRDIDQSKRDRVEIYIDIDRDYSSYYKFVIDHQGNVSDSCFGDRSWDPKCFVAARENAQQWSVELAIPFSQLADHAPNAHDVWAVGLQRIVPGLGFQSWTSPAAIKPIPEGFGLLTFE